MPNPILGLSVGIREDIPPGTIYMLPPGVKGAMDKAIDITEAALEAVVIYYLAPLFFGGFYLQVADELRWLAETISRASGYATAEAVITISRAAAEKRIGCITGIGDSKMQAHRLKDGEIFEVDDRAGDLVSFECCDCGLIHRIAFAREQSGQLGVAIERRAEETKDRRLGEPTPYLIGALKIELGSEAVESVIRSFPEQYFMVPGQDSGDSVK